MAEDYKAGPQEAAEKRFDKMALIRRENVAVENH